MWTFFDLVLTGVLQHEPVVLTMIAVVRRDSVAA